MGKGGISPEDLLLILNVYVSNVSSVFMQRARDRVLFSLGLCDASFVLGYKLNLYSREIGNLSLGRERDPQQVVREREMVRRDWETL